MGLRARERARVASPSRASDLTLTLNPALNHIHSPNLNLDPSVPPLTSALSPEYGREGGRKHPACGLEPQAGVACENESNPEPTSGTTLARLALQQAEGGLRACVGLRQDRRGGGGENLTARQVRRLFREVSVANRALRGADV